MLGFSAIGEFALGEFSSFDVAPALFSNTQTFFSPEITRGAVTLTAPLTTNTQTFFDFGTGEFALDAPLLTNTQTFFSHDIPGLTVTLDVDPFINTQTFFTAELVYSADLAPALFTNTQTFFTHAFPLVTTTLKPELFTNTQTFFSASVGFFQVLAPSLFTNTQTFFSPDVFLDQFVTPSLFTNDQTFFSPEIFNSLQEIEAPLFTNSQIFFPVTVESRLDTYFGVGHYLEALREAEQARRRSLGIASKRTFTKIDRELQQIDRMERSIAIPMQRTRRQPIAPDMMAAMMANPPRRGYTSKTKRLGAIAELESSLAPGDQG